MNVAKPEYRSNAFGFLHALDISGGLASTLLALLFTLVFHFRVSFIIFLSVIPLFISTLLLFFIKRDKIYVDKPQSLNITNKAYDRQNKLLFIALLVSATFYGFSFYKLGFPILTAALSHNYNYSLGILTYAVYLGVAAFSGYLLGSSKLKPIRALWMLGYLPSALASLFIGLSIVFHYQYLAFYLFVAGLGLGMGAVETYEPIATSQLVHSSTLSTGGYSIFL